ncbi:choice-of-anchor L domain-containing protein [Oerskovia sp. M15]
MFGSEEYAGWSERDYTDSFAILVNGKPCSYVPRTRDLVSTSTINETTNADRFRQNFAPNDPGAGQFDTELNGFTTELTCEAKVKARRVATVTVAIADTRDGQLDSTVLLTRDGLTSERGRGNGGGGGHGHGGGDASGHGGHGGTVTGVVPRAT